MPVIATNVAASTIHITLIPSRDRTLPLVGLGGLVLVVAAALPAEEGVEAVVTIGSRLLAVVVDDCATDWGAVAEGCELEITDADAGLVDDATVPDVVEARVLERDSVVELRETEVVAPAAAEVDKGRLGSCPGNVSLGRGIPTASHAAVTPSTMP